MKVGLQVCFCVGFGKGQYRMVKKLVENGGEWKVLFFFFMDR